MRWHPLQVPRPGGKDFGVRLQARMESQNGLGDVGEGISLRRSSSEVSGKGVRRYTAVLHETPHILEPS